MERDDIRKRVDLNIRYSLFKRPPTEEYVFGVLLFLKTTLAEVETMLEAFKTHEGVDVYLLLFEEGYATEAIEEYVDLFQERFPDVEIRYKPGCAKQSMQYMYHCIEVAAEREAAKLN